MTMRIFKAGNSEVVAIPRTLLQELGVKSGDEVEVEKLPDASALLVRPRTDRSRGKAISAEFRRWLNLFLKEDAELLDRLA